MSLHSKSINSKQITLSIGFLGALFPLILPIGSYYFGSCIKVMPSMSQYYFTVMGDVFVGVLFILATFFFSYKGYDKTDNFISNILALLAFMVALFPAYVSSENLIHCNFFEEKNSKINGMIHNIAAAVFFLLLAYNSFFQFTKTNKLEMSKSKIFRNKIFKTAGVIILFCLVLMAIYSFTKKPSEFLKSWNPIYSLEFVALQAFAISWLVKSGYFIK